MKVLPIFLLLFLSIQICHGQNLIINPDAEEDPLGTGWTSVATGTSCGTGSDSNWRIVGGTTSYPSSQNGTYMFFSGCGSISGEIYQDIDVSAYSATIDAGTEVFTFTGYTHSFNQSPADGARIIVEYSNVPSTVLGSFDTGFTTHTSGWTINSDSRAAPVNTRNIRIRLLSEANNGSSVDGYLDNLSLTPTTVFPIELPSFSAEITHPRLVKLSWKTTQEHNNDFFTVERTINETEWETVEIVDGAGNSTAEIQYGTVDKDPYQGVSHYRLKQTDFDGYFSHSDIVKVNMNDLYDDEAYIFPNPASETVTVVANQEELSEIKIFNIQGVEVNDYVTRPDPNRSNIIIDITNLNPGLYLLQTMKNNLKFYKQ